jgi:hypothetical protein
MNIPQTIKIGAINWKILLVEPSDIDPDSVSSGSSSHETQTIMINRYLSAEMKEQTLLHEILHAVDLQMEHNAVEMLATLLHQVLTENKLNFGA